MTQYIKSPVENIISVTSIATTWHLDLRNKTAEKEIHDFPEIYFVAEGSGHTVIHKKRIQLQAGQMVIYAPNTPHGPFSGGIVEIISFETATPFPVEFCNRPITLTSSQRVRLHQLVEQAIPMFELREGIKGMVLKSDIDQYDIQNIKNKLELFLLDIIRSGKDRFQNENRSISDYMLENIHRMLTLQEMSRELGVSISSLKRLSRETFGKSPVEYFADLKIAEAKRLIANTNLNMTRISEQLGFSSVHYFSRVFKQKTGKTPSEYKIETE